VHAIPDLDPSRLILVDAAAAKVTQKPRHKPHRHLVLVADVDGFDGLIQTARQAQVGGHLAHRLLATLGGGAQGGVGMNGAIQAARFMARSMTIQAH